MWIPVWREWVFAAKTCAAALLALLIAFWLDLPRPYWAMATVYITTQPLSGATRSKAAYRVGGTLIGVAVAVVLVLGLVTSPELLTLAIALWTALCLYLSLLDRTPRAYLFMLSGYTVALIGFPSVLEPDAIFGIAVARAEEICLGILCATLVSSVVFPRPVRSAVAQRVDAWIHQANLWTSEVLSGTGDEPSVRAQRLRLAVDAAEIDTLATHLAYDDGGQRSADWLRILQSRMLMLLPVLSSLADRITALRARNGLTPDLEDLLRDVEAWSTVGAGLNRDAAPLRLRIAAAEHALAPAASWQELMRAGVLERLRAFIDLAADCRTLQTHLARGGGRLKETLVWHSDFDAPARHRDHGMALRSALGVFLTVLVCVAFWIVTAWPDGGTATMMAALVCCLYATQDDPAPAILTFARWSIVSALGAAVLLFGILPQVQDFEMLALVLSAPLLVCGLMIARPTTAAAGVALSLSGAVLLALQETYSADFAAFANNAIAVVGGIWVAALTTRLVRSVGVEHGAARLLRAGRATLAATALHRGRGDRATFAALMLDRLCLLVPRLAAAPPDSPIRTVDGLAQLRAGTNILALRRARHGLPQASVRWIDRILDDVARYYRGPDRPAPGELCDLIDAGLRAVGFHLAGARRRDALLGLAGLRHNLFPDAPDYRPEPDAMSYRDAA